MGVSESVQGVHGGISVEVVDSLLNNGVTVRISDPHTMIADEVGESRKGCDVCIW